MAPRSHEKCNLTVGEADVHNKGWRTPIVRTR